MCHTGWRVGKSYRVGSIHHKGILWWGPGLVSLSPDSIRRLRIQAEWEVEGFRFRAELFLKLLGSEWNGCGEVRARLTCGREKSAVWLFFG